MIRKITPLLAIVCLFFNSCTTDIEVNTPGLQATIDGKLFRPDIKKAIIHDDGTLVIVGNTGNESISFTTSSTDLGTYRLEQQAINTVSFEENDIKFISENGITNGQIIITEIYNNQISGNFYFEDLKGTNGKSMSFRNGWFYRLPIENFVPEVQEEEEEIIINVEEEEEEEDPEINPCLLNASLVAMINGNEMITDDHDAIPFGVNNPSILIKASNEDEEITIVFPINVTVGEHSLTGSGAYSATYSLYNDKASAVSGTLTITSHDTETKCISGSFEFITTSGVVVTEGRFEYGY
ncbi:hypothetical protein SAMN04487910_2799 [Aquimarina amphilecti]|uniref:Uncharacterized protein n=1 Tax=Aquimarina amphilecti TaxID=1038014 RepID=A0A1H7RM70_AQUAM|nr:DUF6252 family protein [Aquimarina amphilecti]SEL61410.1 hypothetical protein SAMN04487910_2799 [Aquimarina amphilecti]